MSAKGKVYFVGAGPGDPDLLTLKSLELIRECDVVIYDSLVSDDIMDLVAESVEKIATRSNPRQKGLGVTEMAEIAARRALKGKIVVRLKSGDPLVFSRIGEEIEVLDAAGVDYEIVPGISSAFYSAATSKTMLTDRRYSSSFALVTGHEAKGKAHSSIDWGLLARSVDVLVVLMGASNMADYCRELKRAGMDGECSVKIVGNASRCDQLVVSISLDEACSGKFQPPSDLCTVIISKNRPALSEIRDTERHLLAAT